MFEASVPVFLRYLERIAGLVDLAERHAQDQGLEASHLLDSRLAADMLPFSSQVAIAANFSLRAAFPLAGEAVPPFGDFEGTFSGLRARLAHVMALLKSLAPAQFEGAGSLVIRDQAGGAWVSLPAPEFLSQYALPNFFFHVTTAYAILRSQGVALSKGDFDGLHLYGTVR